METTTTNVPHISGLDALVTGKRRWLPEIFHRRSENGGHRNERESAPQSISIVK